MLNENKLCVITCVNDEKKYAEMLLSFSKVLKLPTSRAAQKPLTIGLLAATRKDYAAIFLHFNLFCRHYTVVGWK